MGLFNKKNKGSGAQKPLVIGAPTGFKHVAGHSNMALTARPIVGAETEDAALAASDGSRRPAPKPDSRVAEVSTADLTALPPIAPPPPARKGLGKKILSAFRGRKAKGQTSADDAAITTTAVSPAAAPAVSAVSSTSESAPASRPAMPAGVSPVRPSARAAPRIPALDFVGPAPSRAEALAALSASSSVVEPTNVVPSWETRRRWRETSIVTVDDGRIVFSSPPSDDERREQV